MRQRPRAQRGPGRFNFRPFTRIRAGRGNPGLRAELVSVQPRDEVTDTIQFTNRSIEPAQRIVVTHTIPKRMI